MGFDEARFNRDFREVIEHRIESLDMTDLQDRAVSLREVDQFSRLRRGGGHGFLQQYVFAALQESSCNLVMRAGRRDNTDCLAVFERLFERCKGFGVMTRRDVFRSGSRSVKDADQIDFA